MTFYAYEYTHTTVLNRRYKAEGNNLHYSRVWNDTNDTGERFATLEEAKEYADDKQDVKFYRVDEETA